KNNAKAAETRGDILYFLNKGIKQDKLNDPIKSMNHFSVRSILAGWWYLEVNDDQEVIIRWKDSPEKVLQELTTTEGASAPPDKHWIHGIMVHPDFSSILDAAQAHAENVVESFVTIWQKTTLEQLPEQTEKLTHSIPVIQDAPHHLEIIDKVPLDDKHQREHHIKTLTLRLVVVGIYKARHKFEPCVREKILNCALLGCIRNKPDEMLDIKRKKSQVAQYLSKLNLSKEKKIGRKEEHLDSKVLYDFEKNWPAKIR
ncbi:MAG: hypothetical protein JNJ57_15210, partial [Saprospiraceae bacterium]|nr:hypothetical protein [Saprospiraceae bacterium]